MKKMTIALLLVLIMLIASCTDVGLTETEDSSDDINSPSEEVTTPSEEVTTPSEEEITTPAEEITTPVNTEAGDYKITLSFPGVSDVGWAAVYTAWIEDSEGNNLQNLYICDSIVAALSGNNPLTGTALPYFVKEKSDEVDLDNLDGISGASIQTAQDITQTLNPEIVAPFRICMEIDRSNNGNDNFTDRPCFIYESEMIDLTSLDDNYPLSLKAYMCNDTSSGQFSQAPDTDPEIPGFEVWKYMTSISYISPKDMLLNETDNNSGLVATLEMIE